MSPQGIQSLQQAIQLAIAEHEWPVVQRAAMTMARLLGRTDPEACARYLCLAQAAAASSQLRGLFLKLAPLQNNELLGWRRQERLQGAVASPNVRGCLLHRAMRTSG